MALDASYQFVISHFGTERKLLFQIVFFGLLYLFIVRHFIQFYFWFVMKK